MMSAVCSCFVCVFVSELNQVKSVLFIKPKVTITVAVAIKQEIKDGRNDRKSHRAGMLHVVGQNRTTKSQFKHFIDRIYEIYLLSDIYLSIHTYISVFYVYI